VGPDGRHPHDVRQLELARLAALVGIISKRPGTIAEEGGPLAYSADVRTDGARTNVVDRSWLINYFTFAQNRIAPNIWG